MTSLPFEDLSEKPRLRGFEAFWCNYPRKVGKLAAEPAYHKALKRTDHDTIMSGLRRYLHSKPAYADWCHPATWLNQGRWMDEPDTLAEVKAGIHGGAWKGESLETIAQTVIKYGQSWARCRYPRDVLEQCAAKGLLTDEELAEALR